ncbi:MAG: cysteine desulfurase family protein [Spirosomataceae bacterium]
MIYLDNNATTKVDERIVSFALPYLTEDFGNASSTHGFGQRINQAVNEARQQVAKLIGGNDDDIVFTSGATEAINLAIKGIAENYQDKGKHIITLQTEHSAVLDTCQYLEKQGFEISYLPVMADGLLDLDLLANTLRNDTILVSIMYVNNEIGVIQPIHKIAELAHAKDAFFMTDATQAVGKLPIDVKALGIDLMAFSGHKFHAPKGIGALYVRDNKKKIRLNAQTHGGGHEKGLRSGTLNTFGIVALGKACEVAKEEMKANEKQIRVLRDTLEVELLKLPNTFINGCRENRLYNITNICFEGADSEAVILGLEDIAISNGSACTSTSLEPSHVLKALGLTDEQAFQSLRFSLSKYTTKEDIEKAVLMISKVVTDLRELLS